MAIELMVKVWKEVEGINQGECAVLTQLANFANEDGESCYPSVGTIAQHCRMARTSVTEIIKRLVDKGLIEVIPNPGNRNNYRLLFAKEGGVGEDDTYLSGSPTTGVGQDDTIPYNPLIEPTEERMKRLKEKLGEDPLDYIQKKIGDGLAPADQIPFEYQERLASVIEGFAYVWIEVYDRVVTQGMRNQWIKQANEIVDELGEVPAAVIIEAGEEHHANPKGLAINGPKSLLYKIRELVYGDVSEQVKDYGFSADEETPF